MADLTPKTIGELPSASALDGTELLAISQGGASKKALLSDIVNAIYPVGAIYMSVNSTSPATLFGGTWTQIKDTFLLAAGTTYSAGATGGEATHTLSVAEMPEHRHSIYGATGSIPDYLGGSSADYGIVSEGTSGATEYSAYLGVKGGGQAHNNMPPYLAVYVWKRTA